LARGFVAADYDVRLAGAGEGSSIALIAQVVTPGARIVKSFNHLGYHDLDQDRREHGHPQRRAIAVASDDAEAAATVMVAIDAMGFDPVYAGTLERGTALEAGGTVFGRWLGRDDLAAQLHA